MSDISPRPGETLADALKRERDEARRMLGECYLLSGADPDGDDWRHLWRHAVDAVRDLRAAYDEQD